MVGEEFVVPRYCDAWMCSMPGVETLLKGWKKSVGLL